MHRNSVIEFMKRKGVVYILLVIIFTGVTMLFWYNEWVYSLPTPVPKNYNVVHPGDDIQLPSELNWNDNKPVALHFFNPDCPCSRFNVPHFRSLVKEFGKDVNFAIVVMSDKNYSAGEITDKLKLDLPVLSDTALAALCGVYSTPQAVIIDTKKKLHYRGNYNKSRYCTDKQTNYAYIALEALLNKNNNAGFSQPDLKAYGCELPHCIKQ